nr:hypothetical protein [uncultured Faecalimonas sp.]
MRYKMNLQLFDDNAGAGSVSAQGGSAGNGSGEQNSTGSAAMTHGAGTYTYEQLEEIANARVERSERTALANFFRSQGMTEEEVTQAISDFKTQRAANRPNAEQLQQERDDALKEVAQMKNEKVLTSKGVKSEDLDYVMFKVSKLLDDKTDFEKATDKFLKENPRFVEKSSGTYRVSTGSQSGGAGGKENSNDFINAAIRKAAGR